MILFFVLKFYFRDVKELGKDNLGVPLSERLFLYCIMVGIPVTVLVGYLLLRVIH